MYEYGHEGFASDVDRYLAQDKLVDDRFSRLSRQIVLGGIALALMLVIFENAFILTRVDPAHGIASIPSQLRDAFTYGVDRELGVTVSVGLLAAVATLAVAVVAATWRPVSLDLEVEVAASRAVSAFVYAGRTAAAFTLSLTILAIPNLGLVAVSGMLAFVSVLISVAVQDRQDARDQAVRLAYSRQYLDAVDDKSERLARAYVWTRTRPYRYRTVVLYFLSPWMAVFVLVAGTLIFNTVRADWRVASTTALASFLIGGMSAMLATMAAGFTGIAVRARWSGSGRPEAIVYRIFAAVWVSVPLVLFIFVVWEKEPVHPSLQAVPTELLLVLPPVVLLTLLLVGRHGKGPGVSPWLGAARDLVKQANDARERVREHEIRLGPAGSVAKGGSPESPPNEPRDSTERVAAMLVAAATGVLIWRFTSRRRK